MSALALPDTVPAGGTVLPFPASPREHIALLLHGLSGGGVQRSTLNLAAELIARGHRVDIVVGTPEGASRSQVPPEARLVALRRRPRWDFIPLAWRADPAARRLMLKPVILALAPQKALYYLPDLVRYLARERPAAMISADTYWNIAAVWARYLSGGDTRIVISERNALHVQLRRPERRRAWRWRHAPALIGHVYPQADGIVAVSDGTGDDLAATAGVPRGRIATIYNPVFPGARLDRLAAEPVAHPWFAPGGWPVILGVGRLVKPKDFPTLIRAFALLRRDRPARLVILGEEQVRGERRHLLSLAAALGVGADVDLPGFAGNPYAYMARAAAFALSSYREGLGNVLIEALACGCPVVSTDCPFGPAEILERGRHGRLVPVGDPAALATALAATLDTAPDREALRARGRSFSAERAADRYLNLIRHGSP